MSDNEQRSPRMRFLVEAEINGRVFRRTLRTDLDEPATEIKAVTRVSEVLHAMVGDIFDEILHLDSPRTSVAQRVERERARLTTAQRAREAVSRPTEDA